MKRLIKHILLILVLWANVINASAQSPVPAFPEIQTVEQILSSTSAQHYLKLTQKGNPLLDKRTKKVKQWMVNLKEEEGQSISFRIRNHKTKSLYQGNISLNEAGKWQVNIQEALPGQAVMLLFVADHIDVNKGRIAILPQTRLPFSPSRIEAGKVLVEKMHEAEGSLDFDRWKLGQLRKYGDTGTSLPELRAEAAEQLRKYLQAALQAK